MKSICGHRAAMTTVAVVMCATAGAYFADEISTETLWKLSPTERVAAEKKNYPRNPSYPARMEYFFRDNARTVKGVDMVFFGDSVTECFFTDEAFNGVPFDDPSTRTIAVNRGMSGDHVEGMIARLDVCLRDLQPKKFFFLGGGNDIWWVRNDYKEGHLEEGYRRLIRRAKELAPQTEIIVQTMMPMNMYALNPAEYPDYKRWVKRANDDLRKVAAEEKVKLIDIHAVLSDKDGNNIPRYTIDGIHLSILGYLRWLDELVPTGPEKMRVWRNLAPKWVNEMTTTHTVDGINVPRKNKELILCRRENNTTSTHQTNGWGVEVQVINDRVTSITRSGNMPIPENGIVLSELPVNVPGPTSWLQNNANLGTRIKVTDTLVTIAPRSEKTPAEIYEAARAELMQAMVAGRPNLDRFSDDIERARKGDAKTGRAVLTQLRKINAGK